MTRFTATGWFEIKGVGWEAAICLDHDYNDFTHLVGRPIMIDGATYHCMAVNHFRRKPPWRKGDCVGIVVKQRQAALMLA